MLIAAMAARVDNILCFFTMSPVVMCLHPGCDASFMLASLSVVNNLPQGSYCWSVRKPPSWIALFR